ncbi:MAG: serine--tRNA ligase [Myxococcota bacterium]
MLDARLIADNPQIVRDTLERRHAKPEAFQDLDALSSLITRRKTMQAETDDLRAEKNRISKQVGALMKQGKRDEANVIRQRVAEGKARLEELENERKALVDQERSLLLGLPNILDERVPHGKSDEDNVEVRRWGTPPALGFAPRAHDELGVALGIVDFQRASRIAGARFAVLRGAGARMERALINFFTDEANQAGYTELMVPYIVTRSTMTGTGQLPKFEEDAFRLNAEVNGQDAFLIPTAEVPVTNLHGDEILDEAQLPIRYASFTPCFRSEAGSHGRDTRGLIRLHQFHKVELVHIATPEQSEAEHERMVAHAESLLQKLGLAYRVMMLSGGDIGFGARLCYDIEVWLPAQDTYREISSLSNCGPFQARRMKMRYKPEQGKKTIFCHTLNGSGLAVGRTLVAIMENYQQADGTIGVPEVLRPYMGVDQIG